MLKEILSISGKPGLNKLVSNSSNAIIVESLADGKRFAAYSNAKVISLEDISIYTEEEDMPLKEVFKRIYEKQNGQPLFSHKEENPVIVRYFEEVVPEYDKDRVYFSDLKKIIQWYNILIENNLLDFNEEKTEEPVTEEKTEKETEEKPKAAKKNVKSDKEPATKTTKSTKPKEIKEDPAE